MSKFVCKRKDVCTGDLYKEKNVDYGVYYNDGTEMNSNELEERGFSPNYSGKIFCRKMLYTVNEDNLANDLMYISYNNYPIEGLKNISEDDLEFVINDQVNLEALIEYMGYGSDLTQEDLNEIFLKIITHRKWLKKHATLFSNSDGTGVLPSYMYYALLENNRYNCGKPSKLEKGHGYMKRR